MKKTNKTYANNLSDIRHDLKNSLTIIQGYSELLSKRIKTEKEKKWIQEILNESKKLYEIIDIRIR